MEIIQKTKYKCDCCGRESQYKDFKEGSQCGYTIIKVNGSRGAICYGGDWGGMTHDFEKYVCFDCYDKIASFISSLILNKYN